VAAVVNGVTSNFGLLPIEQGGGSCIDSIFGHWEPDCIESSQINVSSGSLFLFQSTTPGTAVGTTQVNVRSLRQL